MATVQVINTTLFHVAAQKLGDATQWYRIALLNNLSDPVVSSVTDLILPPLDASLSDGLPSQ